MKRLSLKILSALIVFAASLPAWAQNCFPQDEIPDQTKTAIQNAAQQLFTQASNGDVNSIKADTIPSLQGNFAGVAAGVTDNKAALAGAHPQIRSIFLLDTGPTPSPDGKFFCGVFGANGMSANGAEFDIPGLAAGKYAVVIQDFIGSKGPYSLGTTFQEMNGGWKLADFYVHPEALLGHDGLWYLKQARDYKTKGQTHAAWFYYVESWELLAPVRFMSTRLLGKIIEESNLIQPKDLPLGGKPVSYSANGKTYNITDISVLPQENSFDLSIKYSVPSTADFAATAADAKSLATAYVNQYPELKDAFNNVWAHAIDANGGDVPGILILKPSSGQAAGQKSQ